MNHPTLDTPAWKAGSRSQASPTIDTPAWKAGSRSQASPTIDTHMILSLFHLAFVVPLFLFVGFQRSDTPRWVYMALLSIGALVLAYHAYRLVQRIGTHMAWIHILHVAVIAPVLLLLGWWGRDSPRWLYEVLLLLAFAAGGYHLFQLVRGLEAWHP